VAVSRRHPRVPLYPVILELGFEAGSSLDYRSVSFPLAGTDLAYRVAVGSYGTSLTRVRGQTWPQARPAVVSIHYGSPYTFAVLVDLQTFLFGSGVGTGVVGMAAILRWAWGFDLDLVLRREKGRAAIEEARAGSERFLADQAEARLRRARADRELTRVVTDAPTPPRDVHGDEQALELVTPRQEVEAYLTEQAAASEQVEHDANRLQAAMEGRRAAVQYRQLAARLGGRFAELRSGPRPDHADVRAPRDDESTRLELPTDGSPPRLLPLHKRDRE